MSASNGVKNNFRASIVVICFALALAIGVIRYLTGPEWALSALYLFPIILVTWKAGIGAGILMIDAADAQMYFAKQNGKNWTRYKVIAKENIMYSPVKTTS